MAITVPPPTSSTPSSPTCGPSTFPTTTEDDRLRAERYQVEASRRALRGETDDFASFLDKLQLEIDLQPLDAATLERAIQLGRRTNQFHLRPSTLDGIALDQFARRPGHEVWTATVRDRFGDYGQVGGLVLRHDGATLEVINWMLSCRVLGRGVEQRLVQWLADRCEQLGCTSVMLVAEHTPRNVPARRLVAALGGGDVDNQRLAVTASPAQLRELRFLDRGDELDS